VEEKVGKREQAESVGTIHRELQNKGIVGGPAEMGKAAKRTV
jgi:hypothetical protein